jgi:uncharacterized membrane protein
VLSCVLEGIGNDRPITDVTRVTDSIKLFSSVDYDNIRNSQCIKGIVSISCSSSSSRRISIGGGGCNGGVSSGSGFDG